MPRKPTTTKEAMIEGAFRLIREKGHESLTARNLAAFLGCSTQPILYNFATMEELTAAVYEKADAFHTACILPRDEEGPDALLRLGLNYVRFGHEERHLFRFLFESNRFGGLDLPALMQGPGTGELVDILAQGLCCERAEAEKVFLAFFAVVHGLASLLCNNAMAYDQTQCQTMLETVFYGALASLKGENHA